MVENFAQFFDLNTADKMESPAIANCLRDDFKASHRFSWLQVLQKLNKKGKVYTKALFHTLVVFLQNWA